MHPRDCLANLAKESLRGQRDRNPLGHGPHWSRVVTGRELFPKIRYSRSIVTGREPKIFATSKTRLSVLAPVVASSSSAMPYA